MSVVVVSVVLFTCGLYGVLSRRDVVGVLASIEVMVGGPLLLLTALGSPFGSGRVHAVALLVILLAAAEASVGLGLVVMSARGTRSARVEDMQEVRG